MKGIILTLTLALFTLPIAKAQDIKLNGTTSAESNQIKNVADPTDNQDAGTKAYIDALISDLQDQIDAMQASTGPETYTILDQYTDNIPTGTNYVKLTYYDQYVDAGSIDASPFVITKQTAHEGGILFYGSTELNSKNLENTFRLTASTGNFDFISFNLDNLESNIDYGTESTTTLPRITLTSSSGSSVTYEATVDAYTSDGYTYYTYMFMESGVKSLNWDNVEWVDIKTQYTKAKVKDFILKKL